MSPHDTTRRRLPRWAEMRPLLQFQRPQLRPGKRRSLRALTIWDLRSAARRRAPKAVFDYTDGAAGDEQSLGRARARFHLTELRPSVLRDVKGVTTTRSALGNEFALPFGIAPTGFTRLMHTQGEIAGAGAAAAAGIPFALSTMGTTSIEDLSSVVPHGAKAFQLYAWKDRDRSCDLVGRAAAAGFQTLLVTVDVPVAGARHRHNTHHNGQKCNNVPRHLSTVSRDISNLRHPLYGTSFSLLSIDRQNWP